MGDTAPPPNSLQGSNTDWGAAATERQPGAVQEAGWELAVGWLPCWAITNCAHPFPTPGSVSDVMVGAGNWPEWEYLHHGVRQTL